jgi:hypothetical protein
MLLIGQPQQHDVSLSDIAATGEMKLCALGSVQRAPCSGSTIEPCEIILSSLRAQQSNLGTAALDCVVAFDFENDDIAANRNWNRLRLTVIFSGRFCVQRSNDTCIQA